ncbi:carbonic anhydrase 7-like isoform X2 [Daktulosphaira vitifoliae]|uniref:carbonic anhydrase 7-like isoform X2 n=1 Tax=Daktulosphaira vitifoliae TaxID=58002 RepID=UPI0021AA7AFD|nr:carbonic anhydrase 7-like isoform X2 [Daktulosphaira vitifoliae]
MPSINILLTLCISLTTFFRVQVNSYSGSYTLPNYQHSNPYNQHSQMPHYNHQNSNINFENVENQNPQHNYQNTNGQFESYENQQLYHNHNHNNQNGLFGNNEPYNQNSNNNNQYEHFGNGEFPSYSHNNNNNNQNVGNQRPHHNNNNHYINQGTDVAKSKWPMVKTRFSFPVQSPVNIITRNATKITLPPFEHVGYWDNTKYYVNISNNGRTVHVEPAESNQNIKLGVTGGPLFDDLYLFDQLHLHWGIGDYGSEHEFNGKRYAMELHVVHHNEKYRNAEEAQRHPDGLCVVSYFGEISSIDEDDEEIESFVNDLRYIIRPGSSIKRAIGDEFFWLRKTANQRHYYTYPGSLTTEPFSESVTWMAFTSPFQISRRQLAAFRTLKSSNDGVLINENDRELQHFNNRPIVHI